MFWFTRESEFPKWIDVDRPLSPYSMIPLFVRRCRKPNFSAPMMRSRVSLLGRRLRPARVFGSISLERFPVSEFLGVSPAVMGFAFPFFADDDRWPDASTAESKGVEDATLARDALRRVVFPVADPRVMFLLSATAFAWRWGLLEYVEGFVHQNRMISAWSEPS